MVGSLMLNPKFRMRREHKRVLLYTASDVYTYVDKFLFIHPAWAVLLALFDGSKTYDEVVELFQKLTEVESLVVAEAVIGRILQELSQRFGEPIVVESSATVKSKSKIYDPFDFIIKLEEVDLRSQGRRLKAPLSINYIVTYQCFRRCIYCFAELDQAPKMELLSLNRVKEIIDEAKSLEIHNITFSGGDPFAREDFLQILEYVIKSEIATFVSTKAYLSPRICERLRSLGLQKIQISLDSCNERVANFLTQSPKFFSQIVQSMKNLQREQIEIIVKAVLTPYNILGIPEFLRFLHDLGIKQVHLEPYGRSVFRHSDSLFIRKEDYAWLQDEVRQFHATHPNMNISLSAINDYANMPVEEKLKAFSTRAGCGAGSSALTILPDGKILFCEQLPTRSEFIAGDLRTQSIIEVWNSQAMQELLFPPRERFKGKSCYTCPDFVACHMLLGRCIRDAYNVYRDAYAPDPKCPRAGKAVRLV